MVSKQIDEFGMGVYCGQCVYMYNKNLYSRAIKNEKAESTHCKLISSYYAVVFTGFLWIRTGEMRYLKVAIVGIYQS